MNKFFSFQRMKYKIDITYNIFFYPYSRYRLNIKINQLHVHILIVQISLPLSLASLPTESNYAGILAEIKISI